MKKRRLILRWIWKSALALLIVLVAFILEENIRGHISLARYKAELRAKGEKLSIEEMNLPKPTKPSGAAVDLLMSGGELRKLSERWPVHSLASAFRLRFAQPGRCIVRQSQPDSGLRFSGRTETTNSWEQFAEQVALAREPLRRARTVLQQPDISVPTDYSQGFETHVPQDEAAGSIGTWLSATVVCDLHRKDLDAALGNILAIADLMRLLQDGRVIGLQMDRIWIGENGLDMTWEALQSPGWTDEQLVELQTAWEKASVTNEFVASAEGERATCLDVWEQEIRKPMCQAINWSDSWYIIGVSPWEGTCELVETVTWCLAWKQQDQARGLWLWQNAMENVRSAVGAPSWTMARKHFEQTEEVEWAHHWNFYNRWRDALSAPNLGTGNRFVPTEFRYYVQRLLEYETRREMTVAAIALARYRLRQEVMPPNLAALIPEFCSKIPHDYMDGSDLRYRLNADGTWILYSVGDDGVDNAGDPRLSEPGRLLHSIWQGRDAVWPVAATREEVESWESRRFQSARPSGGSVTTQGRRQKP